MIISAKQIQSIMKAYNDTKSSQTARTETSSMKPYNDEVVLSSQAQEFSQILNSIRDLPEVREGKVQQLTACIQSGNYNVDARDVAEKMIGRAVADKL